MNKSKLAALVLITLALGWAALLFFGLPYVYRRKVDGLVGHPFATVRGELGPPTKDWEAPSFACDPAFRCSGVALGGPVLLYAAESRAFYLYFDDQGVLRKVESSPRTP